MNKILRVKCPQCETIFTYYESEFRPFCCERCKMIDLGHWFKESYRVPGKEKNQLNQNSNEYQENENDQENYQEDYEEDRQGDYPIDHDDESDYE